MRTRQILYSGIGVIYACELERCPGCNGEMQTAYTNKYKTVQTLQEVKRIGQRTKRCINPDCVVSAEIWGSMQWRQIAPVGCTYGYDVIAQIGWQRQTLQQPFALIHSTLQPQIAISEAQVRVLYHERYLPLLACHERQQLGELERVAQQVGLLLTLDGLAPEGGEPQLWVVRELLSGMTLRSGWMSQQDQTAFVNFLRPIAELGLRVRAVLSDKQSALLPAVAEVFPDTPHAFCQVHYLQNVALPLAEADEALKVRVRQEIRESLGESIRRKKEENPGVLTVTGLLPSPVEAQPQTIPTTTQENISILRDSLVQDLCRRIRYLLTLKARPPFRLAGLEMVARLTEVEHCLTCLITHHATPALVTLHHALQPILHSIQATYSLLCEATGWLKKIADLLEPDGKPSRSGQQVRQELFAFLLHIQATRSADPFLRKTCDAILKTTRNYASGLFHCYDIPGLPRTNNDRESEFRNLHRRLLRTTGQKGLSRRILQREGAWELIPHPTSLQSTIDAVSHVAPHDFHRERLRLLLHRHRFMFHTRSARQAQTQLLRLEQRWLALPADTS
jgi:hypothetical protein